MDGERAAGEQLRGAQDRPDHPSGATGTLAPIVAASSTALLRGDGRRAAGASARSDEPDASEGDHFTTIERLVVSPAAGLFVPADGLEDGSIIRTGDIVGRVADHDVRSPFEGVLQTFVALDGERVRRRQPIAWLSLVT